MLERTRGVDAKDVGRALTAFARTARARGLYQDNSQALLRMRKEVSRTFTELLDSLESISLRIRPEAFVYDDQIVLRADDPSDSIPFAFYRDGVRRLDFSRGLTEAELDTLLVATSRGFTYSGLGDDIVSHLWKHDLEHIRYLVVDTNIVDAAQAQVDGAPSDGAEVLSDLDAQIDGLLRMIYGDSDDDVGPRSLHLDGADIAAKQIAASLDDVDELAPGLHPIRKVQIPRYAATWKAEVSQETPNRVGARAANAALKALHSPLNAADHAALLEALLRIFDAAVVGRDLALATRVAAGVRSRGATEPRIDEWLREAINEARMRQLASGVLGEGPGQPQTFQAFVQLLRACGARAAPLALTVLPMFPDPALRRSLSDLVLELGLTDLSPLAEMLTNEQLFVVQEALYILGRLPSPAAQELERRASEDPRLEVRMAAMAVKAEVAPAEAVAHAERLLHDPDPRATVAAAQLLARLGGNEAPGIMERFVERPELELLAVDARRELFRAYAKLCGVRALHLLSRYVKRGTGLLAKKDAEELAVAALDGVMVVRSPRAVEILKGAAVARSKRVREAARARLQLLKERR